MALPKRRHSHSRTRLRRSHDALKEPMVPDRRLLQGTMQGRTKRYICPQCRQIKAPHTVCPNCGFYKGRQVVQVERT